ncbi:hypothetical protein CPAST_c34840 [Clostridium pasteurianum DSM 525 = ATCC 6013]|uniref:Uncharacterized protein n=1 Tax=Clostridium pasteurianum DSM 525 = ATCC 6013 TaxID=1262449 RepID=A0A0H3JBD6_CLOPA|nr:hypothetical protein [Clostridium pasteurianum]AJA49545.1 hypothetical protein CPAST_c34840 [Clostridium pasteurianum DSM 525 = ATCC 6013]AJA53533.1 hypothetical protein CLPA_c34840 [Clostridium pasteurianum DSM 525 = ATCC 6013]AOZ76701.1 hypothetical protein AQ983_16920 [Clostridium pasteurianum DSM 525 = ATCC 6013]AOZ80498.1 hypothetical protein AQ984_16915 [Clostridium pasteurianum]ELP58938.1 hypothetical protein F502_12456 [Clostridium pasteurianum DSM 525 = ATCC 6013]
MKRIGNAYYLVVEEDNNKSNKIQDITVKINIDAEELLRGLDNIKYEILELEKEKCDEIKDKTMAELIGNIEQQIKINDRIIGINNELIRFYEKELDIINKIMEV